MNAASETLPLSEQPLSERERLQRVLTIFHTALMAVLIALRPLVWDGEAAAPANLVYLALIQVGLVVLAGEFVSGLRTTVRWSWPGLLFAVLVVALVPAAWRAPIPADGSAFLWQLLMHLGLGAYLLQIIPGRERVAWSALVAGLGAEVAIGWIQGLYVLPKMAAGSAQGDVAVAAEGIASQDLLERISRGGWFGTFTLSNALAGWLLLTVIPLVGAAWQRGSARLLVGALALAGGGLLLATRSKGALLAVLVAAGGWWLLSQRRWWRWLPLPLGALVIALFYVTPSWSAGIEASARVRWGYWSGAVALVREAPLLGHGIGAFAERSSGVMPLWAEPSRMVHNEPLELAVVAGLPLALLLVVLLLVMAWPRRADELAVASSEAGDPAPHTWLASVALIVFTPYLCLLGMLDGNLGWWPGGEMLLGQGAWGVLVGLWMAVVMRLSTALQLSKGMVLPTRRWLRLALAALVLHCLIDFDLHSFAIVGTTIVVAVLAGERRREFTLERGLSVVLLVGVIALGVGWVRWGRTALELRTAQDVVRAMRLTRDPAHVDDGFASLAGILGVNEPETGDRRGRQELLVLAVRSSLSRCASDPSLAVQVTGILPPSAERLQLLDGLKEKLPYALSIARLRAQDYLAAGRWQEAADELRRGVSLAPAYLPARQELEVLLEQIATRDPAHANAWRAQRAEVAAARTSLEAIVDYRNRGQ